MKKNLILLLTSMFILCSCDDSSSTSVPKVPTVPSSSSTTSSSDSSSEITDINEVEVNVPSIDVDGANEMSFEQVKIFSSAMSAYQKSALFKMPTEIDNKVKTTGGLNSAIEGITSLNSTDRLIYSKNNSYYRTEISSNDNRNKTWKYVGSDPKGVNDNPYYVNASLTNDEGKYSCESLDSTTEETYKTQIENAYYDDCFEIVTGNSTLSQFDSSDPSVTLDCKYYSRGAGSLIVTGTVVVNNYEMTFEDTTIKASIKMGISYEWKDYVVIRGETDSIFTTTVLFKQITGHVTSSQTVTFDVTKSEISYPNFDNFTEEVPIN